MKLEFNKIVSDFYLRIKDDYPDISFSQVEKICKVPSQFFKSLTKLPVIPEIRFKYLGNFAVRPAKAAQSLIQNKINFDKGLLSEERYLTLKEGLLNVVNRSKKANYIKAKYKLDEQDI